MTTENRMRSLIDCRWLYFIACGDNIKVGRAVDIPSRMKELQTAAPGRLLLIAAFANAGYLERECHRLLKEQRVYGEWFVFDENVIKMIELIQSGEIA